MTWTKHAALTPLALWIAASAGADVITIGGVRYEDVLVYTSESMVYVKIPQEGRIISAPKAKVSPFDIRISDDPFYRDELKALFDENEKRARAGQSVGRAKTSSAAFAVPEDVALRRDERGQEIGGGASVAGGGRGLGIPRAAIQSALQQFGFTFTENGPESVTARSPDGAGAITLEGPPNNIHTIRGQTSGPPQTVTMTLMGMGQMLGGGAPQVQQWLQQNMGTLMQGGAIQTSQSGVRITISTQQSSPGTMTLTYTVQGG